MALLISDKCINCDVCVDECPNSAIFMGEEIYQIDPSKCTECVGHYDKPTCVIVCPIKCIKSDPLNKESLEQLAQKYVNLVESDS
ncbi:MULTISPECIES: YfhL family 4Fe-4S dicluster ferredoxin [Pseudoalteromonas]|uniref:YfhL family 4Fe-4S dicluster ferredoxin n=1 Tax=Pseudoalteromonas undina TaxID=43660 RepID=A0ACC6R040_9GAMM|nr:MULTISPECIES: YfhL family 4Fe-4S dicluster ferredoxin [unclassified Pseudoalteromonas]KPZ53796.1 putative ferredoxin-like protein [Pseudoalteromonas sp. P1-25]KPZ54351.1 putative ferredoxin-like protein [Pseudoalteromonas sp. P1-13-1a]KPZ58074.1 putative ferredoxin-like protein [Pseudoalteromonas sp. P1-7a]